MVREGAEFQECVDQHVALGDARPGWSSTVGAEEARQVLGQLLADEAQQQRIALAGVALDQAALLQRRAGCAGRSLRSAGCSYQTVQKGRVRTRPSSSG